VDQFFSIENGNAAVVFSGEETVFPVAPYQPRFLGASIYEASTGEVSIRLKLSGRLGLSLTATDNNFRVSGLTLTDAINFENLENPQNRAHNYANDILLKYAGEIDPTRDYRVTHRDYNNELSFLVDFLPSITPELPASVKNHLPEPVWDNHQDWLDLYWAAWQFMYDKIASGNEQNGFESHYIDEGFNENIYQWDSCFMVAYAIYGLAEFPVMATLDNFYNHQRSDGYICRCYQEKTGLATGDNDINPPLFAWAEWRYYKLSGDKSRLARVLPVLDKYFQWIKGNNRSEASQGLYFITNLGSGMDNLPREEYLGRGAWIDISAQQALAALYIARFAELLDNSALATKYYQEYEDIKSGINGRLWDAAAGNYYDRDEAGNWLRRNTIASFWPMIAEVTNQDQANALISKHLKNPREFHRPYLFPALAANDPVYNDHGNYWRGGIWAPSNFATIKGIARYDYELALQATENHIDQLSKVYHEFDPYSYPYPMPSLNDPNIPRNGNGFNQIWEAYAPEVAAPATRWDGLKLTRQKFCGWSGIGPVALLIENSLGFEADGANNSITWRLYHLEQHGIQRLRFGNNEVSLIAAPRRERSERIIISGSAEKAFRLVVYNFDSSQPVWNQMVEASRNVRIVIDLGN
jgi:hypothetical protein